MFKSVTLSSNIYLYADDTLIISRSDNINSVTKKCSEGIEKVSTWCEANTLTMNYKKTKCMIVKHKKTPDVQNIIVRNKQISIVHTYEYLGVLIDEKLSHNDYIESISKKTNNKIGILSRIRRFISVKTAIQIYKCPHLDYIDYVIDSSSNENICKLDKLQNKPIRRIKYCINIDQRKDIDVLHREYNIEKLSVWKIGET